jgi:predicted phage baseplate assembly protein
MPLSDVIPVIDDRRYDQLVAEIRTRIARYTPEWTPIWSDVNDSDPGITLAQLFGWMTELLTYRLGLVPELNYIKFLQLLGIELTPAQPATTQLTFPVTAAFTEPYVIVPLRTQVSADSPTGSGPPVIFETDKALVAVAATLSAVLAYDGYSATDVSSVNTSAALGYAPFGNFAAEGSALMLGFSAGGGLPQVELDLAVWVSPGATRPPAAQCGLAATPGFAAAQVIWQYYDGTTWQPLTLLKDETRGFTVTGHVVVKTPAPGAIVAGTMLPVTQKLYWLRAYLQQSQYAQAPVLQTVRINTVSATQAETITGEVLGGSNGERNQVFQLGNTPVLSGSLVLQIDEGDGFFTWTEVGDFLASRPNDQVYTLDRTSGMIGFGDGINGAIPVANPNNVDGNVVAQSYRVGGGSQGNLPAGAIQTLVSTVTGIDSANVANVFPSTGGRDEETLDAAKQRAPGVIKSRCRAVTTDDYEYLAKQVADVVRAKALPLFHPDFPGVQVPGVVTVIVVPEGGATNPMPLPSTGTLQAVCMYLDQRRLLTTEVFVIPPTYQLVEIDGQVIASDMADLAEVNDTIEAALLTYFHPITGGDDGRGWPFGGTIYFSRVYQQIMNLPGVQSIQNLTINVDGLPAPVCTDVSIKPDALVYSTQHNVLVNYSTGP